MADKSVTLGYIASRPGYAVKQLLSDEPKSLSIHDGNDEYFVIDTMEEMVGHCRAEIAKDIPHKMTVFRVILEPIKSVTVDVKMVDYDDT
jgi:hypothetical protein